MKTVAVRKAQPSDAAEMAAVLARSFAEYEALYTPDAFAATTPKSDEIRRRFSEGEMWVATLEERIVGTVSVIPENESLYIRSMAILPEARATGLGERLLIEIENFAVAGGYRRLFLCTTPFLHRAIRLYERFGFAVSSESPQELKGTPLVTMSKKLLVSSKHD